MIDKEVHLPIPFTNEEGKAMENYLKRRPLRRLYVAEVYFPKRFLFSKFDEADLYMKDALYLGNTDYKIIKSDSFDTFSTVVEYTLPYIFRIHPCSESTKHFPLPSYGFILLNKDDPENSLRFLNYVKHFIKLDQRPYNKNRVLAWRPVYKEVYFFNLKSLRLDSRCLLGY